MKLMVLIIASHSTRYADPCIRTMVYKIVAATGRARLRPSRGSRAGIPARTEARPPKYLMPTRIGYLIPEFPGQTHSFIWRERRHLTEMGIDTALISTRPPPREIISHTWSDAAQRQTTYLAPMSAKEVTLAG